MYPNSSEQRFSFKVNGGSSDTCSALCTGTYSLTHCLTEWFGSSISYLYMIYYSPPLYLQHFAVFLNAWHFVMARWRTPTPPANQDPRNKNRTGTKRPWEQRKGWCRFLVSSGDAHAGTFCRLRLQPGRPASMALPSADRRLFSTCVYCQLCFLDGRILVTPLHHPPTTPTTTNYRLPCGWGEVTLYSKAPVRLSLETFLTGHAAGEISVYLSKAAQWWTQKEDEEREAERRFLKWLLLQAKDEKINIYTVPADLEIACGAVCVLAVSLPFSLFKYTPLCVYVFIFIDFIYFKYAKLKRIRSGMKEFISWHTSLNTF